MHRNMGESDRQDWVNQIAEVIVTWFLHSQKGKKLIREPEPRLNNNARNIRDIKIDLLWKVLTQDRAT